MNLLRKTIVGFFLHEYMYLYHITGYFRGVYYVYFAKFCEMKISVKIAPAKSHCAKYLGVVSINFARINSENGSNFQFHEIYTPRK